MANRTVEAIDREIAECKEELANVKGRETEVYTRIVGYYRAVKNWNKGKTQEFADRKTYSIAGIGKSLKDVKAEEHHEEVKEEPKPETENKEAA